MPRLTDLGPEETGVVVRVMGGRGLKQKLALRGIKEGSLLRMISSLRGPVVVEGNGGQVALGRGMAQKVIVIRRG